VVHIDPADPPLHRRTVPCGDGRTADHSGTDAGMHLRPDHRTPEY